MSFTELGPGLERCTCSPDCDYIRCVTCGTGDCKWPGACKGKCIECGEPARPMPGVDGKPCDDIFTCHCSDACQAISQERWEKEGTFVSLGDLTLEQQADLFKGSGLELVGVGPRQPS